MTAITCKACKHWSGNEVGGCGLPPEWGQCNFIPMLDRVTAWDRYGQREVLAEEHKDLKAAVQDGSSYTADLYTAPEFFCYHGEAK